MSKRYGRRTAQLGLCLGMSLAWASNAAAANGRTDYDRDNDRLIEIDDLGDLNQIRFNPDGNALYGSSAGCPAAGCIGFELSADLNFDTNGSGTLDPGDQFWNAGAGWLPIEEFNGELDGNGRVLRNLANELLLAGSNTRGGLFALLNGAVIRRLGLENAKLIPGEDLLDGDPLEAPGTGVLAATALASTIQSVYATGNIGRTFSQTGGGLLGTCGEATSIEESYASVDITMAAQIGGLVGSTEDCDILRSFATGRIFSSRGHFGVGGLVGVMGPNTLIRASFASGNAGRAMDAGGLVGLAFGGEIIHSFATGYLIGGELDHGGLIGRIEAGASVNIANSYWATNTTGQAASAGGGGGRTLAELQCSTVAADSACGGLFPFWNLDLNSAGQQVWELGTRQELPGLRIMGRVIRDADGDGSLDGIDAYRLSYAASLNSDADSATDRWKEGCNTACQVASGLTLDQFPTNAAASRDLDLDGRPDAWGSNCVSSACRNGSGLVLDTRPGDLDNDAVLDSTDTDDNNDSSEDADPNSNGLVDVATLTELDAIRNKKSGSGQCLSGCPQETLSTPPTLGDASGCPPMLFDGVLVRRCQGYELVSDLNFDANGNGVADDPFTPWDTIGYNSDDLPDAFRTVFDGNGHTISNVTIVDGGKTGFFGGATDAVVRNVTFGGPLMSVTASDGGAVVGDAIRVTLSNVHSTGPVHGFGDNGGLIGVAVQSSITGSSSTGSVDCPDLACNRVGGLVGQARHTTISGSFATGNVGCTETGHCSRLGGLVGQASHSTISASFATGDVLCFDCSQIGGLVGEALDTSTVSGSFSAGRVDCEANCSNVGGLLGATTQNVTSSYWSRDTSTQTSSAGNAVSATLTQLQCATPTSGGGCAPTPLFVSWNGYTDPAGAPYWSFGTATQLPGLCLSGRLYRDGNADGELDPITSCGNGAIQAVVNVYDQFTNGYCARLTVTNTGSTAIDPWAVTFTVQGTVNQSWNMTYTQAGSSLTARPINWNPRLEPGQSTHDIGFCAAL
ncbi:MAG: hypothetical protein RL033_4163 [Pseudomonadota bacterium]